MTEIENPLFYQRIKKREDAAFNQLIAEYSKLLWAIGSRMAATNAKTTQMDLEEVVSDVYLRLWQHPEKFDPKKGTLKTYLVVMMESMTKNKLRQRSKHQHEDLEQLVEPKELTETNDPLSEKELWQEIYQLVMEIEEPTRKILIWRLFYDLKPDEIVKRSGLSAKEVDNRLYRGKIKLRKLIQRNAFFREVEGT